MSGIKLRGIIAVDVDAEDYKDAARLQEEFEDLVTQLSDKYGPAALDFRERRERGENTVQNAAKRPRRKNVSEEI